MGEVTPADAALHMQLAAIAGNEPSSSFLELRPLTPDGRPATHGRTWVPVGQLRDAMSRVRELESGHNVFVGAAPRVRHGGKAEDVERVWCLWCDADGPEALRRLAAFRPMPSIVIRTGSPDHAHAYWQLRVPLPPGWAQRANRRIALALGADMGATDPARVLRAAGTLNHKTSPPREVRCTRLELSVFTFAEVVGGLPDSNHYAPSREMSGLAVVADPDRRLAGVVRALAGAEEGSRNALVFWGANRVREHIAAGQFDPAVGWHALRAAAAQTGLPDDEIERTIASAERSAA